MLVIELWWSTKVFSNYKICVHFLLLRNIKCLKDWSCTKSSKRSWFMNINCMMTWSSIRMNTFLILYNCFAIKCTYWSQTVKAIVTCQETRQADPTHQSSWYLCPHPLRTLPRSYLVFLHVFLFRHCLLEVVLPSCQSDDPSQILSFENVLKKIYSIIQLA